VAVPLTADVLQESSAFNFNGYRVLQVFFPATSTLENESSVPATNCNNLKNLHPHHQCSGNFKSYIKHIK
jgi:hypothetical protein